MAVSRALERSMAWTGTRDRGRGIQEHGVRRHLVAPVLPVLVPDHEADRAAERPPPAHARIDLDRIFLDLHAVAAAIPHLPPREIAVYVRYPDQ